jgi:CheY-like chemotaxis protein
MWQTDGAPPRLRLVWSEHGGPTVKPPSKRGFGSYLIEKILAAELDATADLQFPPHGVIFTLEVALSQVLGKNDGSSMTEGLPPVTALRRGDRVLVVEDEALIGEQVSELLSHAQIEVEWVATVARGEHAVGERNFTAAILDVNLNGEMVFPVARLLETKGIPFVFLTGYDTVEVWPPDVRYVRRLTKPLNLQEFCKAFGLIPPFVVFDVDTSTPTKAA